MSYNNGYSGDGFGGCGLGWIILLLFCFCGGNGNGFGGWGNNGNLATATETASLVQQDNMRSQVAGIESKTNQIQSFVAGLADGQNRIQDKQLELRTDLCQLGNSFSTQLSQVQFNNQQQFCQLKQEIVDNRLAIQQTMNDYRMEDLKEKNAALQSQLERQTFLCNNNAQTDKIIAAINERQLPPPPAPCGAGYGAGYGAGACAPCGPSTYELRTLAALEGIGSGIQQLLTTTQANTTTLSSVLTRVNEIPTTTA